jgi:hypothetical protein
VETHFEISVSSIIALRLCCRQGGILAEFRAALLCNLTLQRVPSVCSHFARRYIRLFVYNYAHSPAAIFSRIFVVLILLYNIVPLLLTFFGISARIVPSSFLDTTQFIQTKR